MNFKANQITSLLTKINFRFSGLNSTSLVAPYQFHVASRQPTLKSLLLRQGRYFSSCLTLCQRVGKGTEYIPGQNTLRQRLIDPQAREKSKIIYFTVFVVCLLIFTVYMMFEMNRSFDIVYVGNEDKK